HFECRHHAVVRGATRLPRPYDLHRVAARNQAVGKALHGEGDTVDFRWPGFGDDADTHARLLLASGAWVTRIACAWLQRDTGVTARIGSYLLHIPRSNSPSTRKSKGNTPCYRYP